MQALPELSTIAEAALPGFEAVSSYRLYMPAGVAPSIVHGVNAAMVKAMQSADALKAVTAEGAEVAPALKPGELRFVSEREFAELEKVVRGASW